jgi:predicted O-methyltransferase YrrM
MTGEPDDFPGEFNVSEYEDRLVPWSDMQGHMAFLRDTVAACTGPVVIELGTRSGNSTAAFLAAVTGNSGELWSVDISAPDVPEHWHALGYWSFLEADDVSPEAQEWLPAQCDVLFIDTSHEYGHTLEELRLYVPRVKPGGVVLLHDTEWEPPGHALDRPGGTVNDALNAWCEETGRSWENRTGSYGLGIVRIAGQ